METLFHKFKVLGALVILISLSALSGCSGAAAESSWKLKLEGAITETIKQSFFEEAVTDCHGFKYTDPQGNVWEGIPLWYLVGRVDDKQKHNNGAFNDSLADSGYTITINTPEQNVELNSQAVKRNNNIIVANRLNGNMIPDQAGPLKLVGGDIIPSQQVGGITSLKLTFTR
jgi:hypothetical protein